MSRSTHRPAALATYLLAPMLILLAFLAACDNNTEGATQSNGVPADVPPGAANQVPQDIQKLEITVANGKFEHDKYTMQQGAIQLVITADGGPYTFTVQSLVAPQPLEANAKTTIGVNVPTPGQYSMAITGKGEGTAILDVRPPGGK